MKRLHFANCDKKEEYFFRRFIISSSFDYRQKFGRRNTIRWLMARESRLSLRGIETVSGGGVYCTVEGQVKLMQARWAAEVEFFCNC